MELLRKYHLNLSFIVFITLTVFKEECMYKVPNAKGVVGNPGNCKFPFCPAPSHPDLPTADLVHAESANHQVSQCYSKVPEDKMPSRNHT
jgi:hypothetical protein